MVIRPTSFAIAVVLSLTVNAEAHRTSRHWTLFGERSIQTLGSEDPRNGFGFGVQWAWPDKRLDWSGVKGTWVLDTYALITFGNMKDRPKHRTDSVGVLLSARYPLGRQGTRWSWEAGWGLNYQGRTSMDLDTHLNSTPTGGVRYAWGENDRQFVAARWMHISNAGTHGRNRGQNQLHLMYGQKF